MKALGGGAPVDPRQAALAAAGGPGGFEVVKGFALGV